MTKHTLVIIRGPVGVGKTAISNILTKKINAKYFSLDKLLKKEKLDRFDPKEGCVPAANFLMLQEQILPEIQKHLERQDVIVSGSFYHGSQLEFFQKNIHSNMLLITMKATLETCIKRNSKEEIRLGENMVRAIYNLVSRFDVGTIIDVEEKPKYQIVDRIEGVLKRMR
ncbi:MAG: hypothetical protein WCI72_00495 [archaeon]